VLHGFFAILLEITARSSDASTRRAALPGTGWIRSWASCVCPARAGFGKPVEWSLEAGDVLATPLLAGLELPLSEVFRP